MSDDLLTALSRRVLIADGATGTMLQAHDLTLDDFEGHEGCNEILNVTRPDVVRSLHDAFFEVGVDAVETNRAAWDKARSGHTMRLAKLLEELTHLEARVTILGYVQRGGTPSCHDRLLATRLGTAAVELIRQGKFGYMVASRDDNWVAVPIEKVAKGIKTVPIGHWWIESARRVGTSLGD